MPRVFYIGQLWQGGTCLERARVLAENGWDLVKFDITAYQSAGGRLRRGLEHRLLWGPSISRFNHDVLLAARVAGNFDVIWVDKGRWLQAYVLDELKRSTGALAVHYTPDPAFSVHDSRHFAACLPIYDLCITTKRYELETYRRNGAKTVLFTWQGVDDRFERVAACSQLDHRVTDVIFIGHSEAHYAATLESVRKVSTNLRIYGPGWERMAKRRTDWQGFVEGPIWGDAYPQALAQGRIGIGLLSKLCPDAFTTRSFEVPAAGAMLCAERTAEHQMLFEEDREAVFFGSTDELCDKIRFYLANEHVRRGIAEAGRDRVLANFHWRHVLAPAVRCVEEIRRAG